MIAMLERLLAEPLGKKPGEKVTPWEAAGTLGIVVAIAVIVVALRAAVDRLL